MKLGGAAILGLAGLMLAGCNHTLLPKLGGGSVGGTVSTGLVGTAIGRDLDAATQRAAREAEYRALEYGRTGTPVAWEKGAAHGEVVPGASYKVNAYDCRDYTHTLVAGTAAPQSARGTACRQADGVWQPVT